MTLQPSSPTMQTASTMAASSLGLAPCPVLADTKPIPVPAATKDTPFLGPNTPINNGAFKTKGRPSSKLTQRSKAESALERLEKLLSPEGILEFAVQTNKDRDDSSTASDAFSSPVGKKKAHDEKSAQRRTRGTTIRASEKDIRTSRVFDRMKAGSPDRQKFKEIEALIEIQEKEKARLQAENDTLREVALIAQQTSLMNESRFQEEIRSLEAKLQAAVLARLSDNEKMNSIRLCNRKIQDQISNLRGVAEHQAQIEKENLVRAFTKQIELKAAELEEERRNGQNTTGEWVLKNQELQEQIDTVLYATEAKHETQKALIEQNKALTVEFNAQADDGKYLKKQFDVVRKRNIALKERIHELEAQLSELSKQDRRPKTVPGASTSQQGESPHNPDENRHTRFEEALERVKRLSEMERRNLNQVKAAHSNALSTRTELEVLLKQTINKVQDDLSDGRAIAASSSSAVRQTADVVGIRQPTTNSSDTADKERQFPVSEFTAPDRRRVIELLLSQERVLQLLYADDKPLIAAPTDDLAEVTSPLSGASGTTQLVFEAPSSPTTSPPSAAQMFAKWKKGFDNAADGGSRRVVKSKAN